MKEKENQFKDDIKNGANCFAWLSENECNALSEKKCSDCSFFKHFSEELDYAKWLPKEYQESYKKKVQEYRKEYQQCHVKNKNNNERWGEKNS